jgi:hypothetical protein
MLMPYAVLFLLFAAVLIAAYFYLMRAKARDAARGASSPSTPATPDATSTHSSDEV